LSATPRGSWWSCLGRWARAIETSLIALLLGGLVLLASAQIVLRNLFSIGFTWSDALTRLIVLWLALLGALAASRDGRHVTMAALVRWLPQRFHKPIGFCADTFAAVVSGALAWHAGRFVADSREFADVLLSDVPAWWLQSVMPVAFGLIALEFAARALGRLLGRDVRSAEI
jgi:TRAP-type C4-dicarboxylate transport system permease small subunit